MVQMFVYRVGIDPAGHALVILTDEATKQFLPIWIGPYEAHAIAAEIEEKEFERPLTHDLLCTIIGSLDSRVVQVAVTKLTDQTFYAEVTLEKNGQAIAVDSRPSDAIALALKTGDAIFVAEEVLARAGVPASITLNTAQVMNDPHFTARGTVVEIDHPVRGRMKTIACVPRLSGSPVEIKPAPLVGEHNAEIYGKLMGYGPKDLERLKREGIIS